jgi:DDB1- and CUL4-associated factor 1
LKTSQIIRSLTPTIMNQYNKNRATFCPTDELILSDGVLWDFRSQTQIHKFDKLNNTVSGVFHPNGLEVVSNTEVWDLRTFHLLRTIPALDQCQVKFSPLNVMYAYSIQAETVEEDHAYDTSFKVLDSYDYTSISTTDVRKSIYDLAINSNGCQIALCENQGVYDSMSESVVRVYTVGRKRDPEDDPEEDDDDELGSDEEDGMDDSLSENGEGNGEKFL